MPPSLDGDEDLIQVPSVAPPALSTLEPASVCRIERDAPQPDRFVGHREAALGQEIFDIAKAHTEGVIQPDGVADDLGGESGIRGSSARHVSSTKSATLPLNLTVPWRRLVLPKRIERWSLTSLQQRLVKTGARFVSRADQN